MGPLVPTGTDIDRETLLDITVNLIPIGILAFFVVTFLVYTPFPPNLSAFLISHFLTIFPLVLLALLTYVAAKVIARDERKLEERSSTGGLEAHSTAGESEAPTTGDEGADDETTEGQHPADDGRGERRSERDIDSEEEDELGVRHEDGRNDEREQSESADTPEADGAATDTDEPTDERR